MLPHREFDTVMDQSNSAGMRAASIVLVAIEKVRPTEEINPDFADSLCSEISALGYWTHPVLLDDEVYAVMDGHHRFAAARKLGLRSIPAVLMSYDDPGVRLESWRPDLKFTPADLRARAVSGELLPFKSTRHVTDFPIPEVRVSLGVLSRDEQEGAPVQPAAPHPTRAALLTPFYHRIAARMSIRADAATKVAVETPESQAPHTMLRRMLQADPAMAALLPVAPGRMVLGNTHDSPFFLKRSGLLLLPPTLLSDAAALAAAARWGLEASHLQANGLLTPGALHIIIEHGMGLLRRLPLHSRDLIFENIPERLRGELLARHDERGSRQLLEWQMTRIERLAGSEPPDEGAAAMATSELWQPLEALLVAGGDSRLDLDPRTGFNRYGATPRPRPEAVHFSSSTASSISDYGFMFCDMLRRDLIAATLREGSAAGALRSRASDALGRTVADMLKLSESEADVVLAASGTDTELLSVMVALAAGKPLLNILLAPDETGRGVRDAGEGKYFDAIAATGAIIRKGQSAWPSASIQMVEVAIRDEQGAARRHDAMARELRSLVGDALRDGKHVLLHLLGTSKTGLSISPEQTISALADLDPESFDVVVDACQMRTRFELLGEWVRSGWMVQISGSKFLTGPPFSGALVLPPKFRDRADPVARLLASAPGVGHSEDWNGWWRDRLKPTPPAIKPSFGPVFRWLPALLESKLLDAVSPELMRYGFERFRAALNDYIAQSDWLVRIDEGAPAPGAAGTGIPDLATSSIICFSVTVADWNGERRLLDEEECRKMFQLLNTDVSRILGRLSPAEEERARQQAHIGQPVALKALGASGPLSVLRLVLGARFFTIIGHAGPGSVEAALESEIGDAVRAIEKLEMLASRWVEISSGVP